MSTPTILTLPGLHNSGEGHWQTLWESTIPVVRRVAQREWDTPDCDEWVATLDQAIAATEGGIILVAHSLGCALTVAWSARHAHARHGSKVQGALLVAPPDVERADFPKHVTGFAPMPTGRLPFKAIVLASTNDPWCAIEPVTKWSRQWGAEFHQIGAKGHINGDSGLANWEQGQRFLHALSIS